MVKTIKIFFLLLVLVCCSKEEDAAQPEQNADTSCTSEYEGPDSFESQQRDAFCELAFIYRCIEGLSSDNEVVVDVCNTYNNDAFWGTSTHPDCPYCSGGSGGDASALGEHYGKEVMFFSRNEWDYPLYYNDEGITTIYGNPNVSDMPFITDTFTPHFTLDQPGNSGDLTFKFKTIIPDPEYAFNGVTHEKEMSFSAVHLESERNYVEIEDNNFKVWSQEEIESFKDNLPIVKFTVPKTEIKAGELIQIENNSNIDIKWRWEFETLDGVKIDDIQFGSQLENHFQVGRYIPNGIFYMKDVLSSVSSTAGEESFNPQVTSIIPGNLIITAQGLNFDTEEFTYSIQITINPIESSQYNLMTDSRNNAQYYTINLGGIEWMTLPLYLFDERFPYIQSPDSWPYYDLGYLINNNLLNDICPEGWRLPTESELGILSGIVSSTDDFYSVMPLDPLSYFYSNLSEWKNQDNFRGTYFNNNGEAHMILLYESGIFHNGRSGGEYMPCTCVRD